MAIRKVKYNDTFVYIEDEVSEEEKGYAISKEKSKKELEKTKEFVISNDDSINLENTIILPSDMGDNNE